MCLENMANDYANFAIKIFHDGKLWDVGDITGIRYNISEQQLWKIDPHYRRDADGEIEFCKCSYPYLVGRDSIFTCLEDDNGRNLTFCPNCNYALVDEDDYDEDDSYDDTPSACVGCGNYDGEFYGDNQLICAIHPYGCNSDICPDFNEKLVNQDIREFIKRIVAEEYDIPGWIFKGIDEIEINPVSEFDYDCKVFLQCTFLSDYPKDVDPNSIRPEGVEISFRVFLDVDREFKYDCIERIN